MDSRYSVSHLFVSDLDGTLLVDGRLERKTCWALNEMLSENRLITFSTGRTIESALDVLRDVEMALPLIVSDGAYIYYPDGSLMMANSLSNDQSYLSIIEFLFAKGFHPIVEAICPQGVVFYYVKSNDDLLNWCLNTKRTFKGCVFKETDCLASLTLNKTIVRITLLVVGRDKNIAKLIAQSGLDVFCVANPHIDDTYWITVISKSCNKGVALFELAKYLGLSKDNITYYGDGLNDIPVVDFVGETIAIETGDRAFKDLANRVIPGGDSMAVVNDIRQRISDYS